MNSQLDALLARVSMTASWFGIAASGVHDRNSVGDTPLHTVCTWGDVAAASLLIKSGADINSRGDHDSPPLINAVISGNVNLLKMLLDLGADISLVNDFGYDPLGYAKAIGASDSIVRALKKKVA